MFKKSMDLNVCNGILFQKDMNFCLAFCNYSILKTSLCHGDFIGENGYLPFRQKFSAKSPIYETI